MVNKTGIYYSCDEKNPANLFSDIPATHQYCKQIHFIYAKGIIGGCTANKYCPSSYLRRDAIAKIISNAFNLELYASNTNQELVCSYNGKVSWGGYDFISDPNLQDAGIAAVVNEMNQHYLNSFRMFVNAFFSDNVYGIHPYAFDKKLYDLKTSNDDYWRRLKIVIDNTGEKSVITLGHKYQCNPYPGPWCKNKNKYKDFITNCPVIADKSCKENDINISGNWIVDWNNMDFCKMEWIKCEYERLAERFRDKGV